MIQQGQKMPIEGEQLEDMRKGAVSFDELSLLNNNDITLTGIESFNGTDAYAVKNDKTTLYFDVKTGLKIAEVIEVEQMGQKASQTSTYSDYKEVKGIKIPFKRGLTMGPGMEIEMTVSEAKINEGVSDADFQ